MSRLRVSCVLVCTGFALASSPRCGLAELKADVWTGKKLLSEGDALADDGDTTEAVIRYKQAFEQLLPGMRGLPFKHEVKRDVTAREDMGAVIRKEIDEDMTPAQFRADELGMKALGLLPRDLNLKETMVRLYSEEVAAFYDPKTKTMHLIKEPEAKLRKAPSFLERLMGKKGGFDKDENKTVISHELTHALADQNFGLDAMLKAIKRDDDRELALSSLIEGEATLTMLGAQMEDWTGQKTRELSSARLELVMALLMPFATRSGGTSLREAPVILSETMIFPYLRGLVFCARLTNDGGWPALDRAYRNPPLSTEQILHPEKYHVKPDPPTDVDLGTLDAGPGWKEAGRNVVGEMQLGVMLRDHGGKAAAAGWDGDRFAVFEGPGERLGLVWFTTWDSEDEAREFVGGYARFQGTKIASDLPRPDDRGGEAGAPSASPTYVLEQRGPDVVIVEGFPPARTALLVEAAFRSRKTEKGREPASPKPEK